MRISKEKAAENREKVMAAAAKLFRERGLEGVGVDALAEAAGLTHGAVYSHFKSKDELAAEAVAAGAASVDGRMARSDRRACPARMAFEQLLKIYVSRSHRDHPKLGCSIAAIGSDAPRAGDELRDVFAEA